LIPNFLRSVSFLTDFVMLNSVAKLVYHVRILTHCWRAM